MARHRQQAGEDGRGLGAAKGIEDVVGDLGGAEQAAGQAVADRHAVLQGEKAVARLQHQPALRQQAEGGEAQTAVELHQPDVP